MEFRIVAISLAIAVASVLAQEFRGTISGSVTDAQGAAIPRTTISAIETQTGTKSSTVSDSSGKYTIPFLAPGHYRVTAEATGFKRFVQETINLASGDHPVLDIHLEVGNVRETINVTEDPPLLETAHGSVSQTITMQQVEDVPSNGRTPIMMAQFSIGVVATPSGSGTAGVVRPVDNSGAAQFSIAGAPSNQNELQLDGAPDNSVSFSTPGIAYNPPQDAVREVRVQAFASDASYGHAGGGTANHITKSGTNSFHGSAYDFNQVSALAASNFFSNKAGLKKPVSTFNQPGLSAGGPFFIPKLLDGRNRAFWFFAWETLKSSGVSTSLVSVPTEAERLGDFSALLALNTATTNYQIYDPLTGAASGNQVARLPFARNIIPPDRRNAIAMKYLEFYPKPNFKGLADGTQNYATNAANLTGGDNFNNWFGRVDFNVSDRHKVFGTVRQNYRSNSSEHYFDNVSNGLYNLRTAWGLMVDDVYTLNPVTFLDIRLNWTRFVQNYALASAGFDPTTLGFPSYIAANSNALRVPAIVLNSFQSFNTRSTTDQYNPGDSFQMFGNLVRTWGNQTLKFGADAREYRMTNFSPGNATGRYTFGPEWTRGPLSNSPSAPLGQDFAAFLLGLPSSGSYDINTSAAVHERYFSLFLQDDWRVRRNLTLNIGIRFETETPTYERYNRSINGFDMTATSPIAGAATAAYARAPIAQIPVSQFKVLGGLAYPSANDPAIYDLRSNVFSPRVGLAWTPNFLDNKTVIRGGFGIFMHPTGIQNGQNLNQQGFSQTTQFQATTNNFLSPATAFSDPFPTGILKPVESRLGLATFLGQSIVFFNPQPDAPRSYRWNIGLQKLLPGNTVLEVAYIGNHAVDLPVNRQLNYVPRSQMSASPVRDQTTIALLGSSVPNPFAGLLPGSALNGTTVALRQILPPFPQFPVNGVTMQYDNSGSADYQSLNVRIEKRYSNGLSLISNFIWNSSIDRTAYLNPFDAAPEKRVSTASRPLRLAQLATYELPIGNAKLINLGSGLINRLLGGWVVNGVFTIQSGEPLQWGNVIYYGGDLHLNNREIDNPAFDVTRFNRASTEQLDSNVRTFPTVFNDLRQSGINKIDASVLKRFPISEGRYFQLRFETFNLANHAMFATPNLSPTNAGFGLITSQTIRPRQIQMGARLVW